MTKSSNDSPTTSNNNEADSPTTGTDKPQDSPQSFGSDPLMQDLLRNMRVQSTDEKRRRELGSRLV